MCSLSKLSTPGHFKVKLTAWDTITTIVGQQDLLLATPTLSSSAIGHGNVLRSFFRIHWTVFDAEADRERICWQTRRIDFRLMQTLLTDPQNKFN